MAAKKNVSEDDAFNRLKQRLKDQKKDAPEKKQSEEDAFSRLKERLQQNGSAKTTEIVFSGSLSFPCCGVVHTAEGEDVSKVVCSICRSVYILRCEPLRPAEVPQAYRPGASVRLLEETTVRVGSGDVDMKVGDVYRVGYDPYGFIPGEGVPLEVESGRHKLLTRVSDTMLEVIDDAG